MHLKATLKGGVLSTIVVVAVLMLLIVFALIALWDADFLLFSRANYLRVRRANIESAFILYSLDPGITENLDADSTFVLFDSVPSSRMKIARKPWGLYEVVTVGSGDGRIFRSGILGLRQPYKDDCRLWYRNNEGAVTLTGKSYIKGTADLPDNGIIYGQMQSTFFSGERLHPSHIRKSEKELPSPADVAMRIIAGLFELRDTGSTGLPDSLTVAFRNSDTEVIGVGEIYDCYLSGNIILTGSKVDIRSDAILHDVIVVADEIRVEGGFRGSVQLFAADSVIVGRNVALESPSGIYSKKYAELGDNSEVNGYLIVDYGGEEDIMQPACRKSQTSKLRGLFYCSGIAQIQGIVSGTAFVDKSVYYSPQGYYSDFLYDIALLENRETAYPLWFDAPPQRKEAKWVR